MKSPIDVAVGIWADAQAKRAFKRKLFAERDEYFSVDWKAFDLGMPFKHDRKRVSDALEAARLFDQIVKDDGHLYRANALHQQAEFLRHAADDAYAEGWSQSIVEDFRLQARQKNELGFQAAGKKRSFVTTRGFEDWDRLGEGSLSTQMSCAYSLVWWHLQHGDVDGARGWFSQVSQLGSDSGLTLNDVQTLGSAFTAAAAYGLGSPQHITASTAAGRPWRPPVLGPDPGEGLVYAEVAGMTWEKIQLKVWRWPVLDGANRLQWNEEPKDWHWVDVGPESFWAATGQLKPRPTEDSILALRLSGEFPVSHSGQDPVYEFEALFSQVVAEVTKDVYAKSLDTVLSVGRDQLSA